MSPDATPWRHSSIEIDGHHPDAAVAIEQDRVAEGSIAHAELLWPHGGGVMVSSVDRNAEPNEFDRFAARCGARVVRAQHGIGFVD